MGKEQKRFYDEIWGNVIRGEGTFKNPVRLSMWDGPIEIVEYMWVNIRCILIVLVKIPECEGSVLPSSFYGQLPDY